MIGLVRLQSGGRDRRHPDRLKGAAVLATVKVRPGNGWSLWHGLRAGRP
jgi:hypothetical protein